MILVLAMLLLLVPQCFAEYTESGVLELFVDGKSNGGDGSYGSPFSSFEEARDYIRELKAKGEYPEKGVTVNFREGKYFLNSGLQLTEEDSGTEEAPITYRAYGNEKVEFLGGASLSLSDFQSVKTANPEVLDRIDSGLQDKIKVVDLKQYGITKYGTLNPTGWTINWYSSASFSSVPKLDEIAKWMGYTPGLSAPELFVDGSSMTLARYPNGDEMSTIASVPDVGYTWDEWNWIQVDDYANILVDKDGPLIPWKDMKSLTVEGDSSFKERVKHWTKAPDIWAYGYWKYNWASLGGHVRSIDSDKGTITLQHPVWESNAVEGQRFYVYNLLEELDVPGEWYLERETGMLYLYPPSESSEEVNLSLLEENLLSMQGVSNVTVKKMNFNLGRKSGIDLQNCRNVTIELCNIGLLGDKGIQMGGDCRNNKIVSNYVYDTNNGGIHTSGGDGSTLEHADNLVENNIICRFSKGGGQSAAIILFGVGDKGRHNKVYDTDGGNIISCGGPYTVLEYNEVFDVMRKAADAGLVYDYQSVTAPGKTIRNNYFHDIGSDDAHQTGIMGVYVDGMGHGHTVTQNVFENFRGNCIFFNGGWNNVATDNIAINCNSLGKYTSIGAKGGEGIAHQKNQVEVVKEALEKPAFQQFTKLQEWLDAGDDTRMIPKYNVVKDNVVVNTEDLCYQAFSSIPESMVAPQNDVESSLSFNGDPGFEDMQQGNYSLKENSEIYAKIENFNAPEFKKMGLYTPWLAYKLKGTLSLAIDSQTAYKDFQSVYIDENDRTVAPKIIDDVTYLPIRFIAESMEGDVNFNEAEGKAIVNLDDSEMIIDLKNKSIAVNGQTIDNAVPIIRGGRTLIPVRVLETTGKTVTWYGEQRVVIVSSDDAVIQPEETELLNELKRRLS